MHPIDPGKPEDRVRLLSYVWADQVHRLQRTEAALNFAAAHDRRIDKADAVDWVAAKLAEPQPAGTTRVLFHTIVWDYIPRHPKPGSMRWSRRPLLARLPSGLSRV